MGQAELECVGLCTSRRFSTVITPRLQGRKSEECERCPTCPFAWSECCLHPLFYLSLFSPPSPATAPDQLFWPNATLAHCQESTVTATVPFLLSSVLASPAPVAVGGHPIAGSGQFHEEGTFHRAMHPASSAHFFANVWLLSANDFEGPQLEWPPSLQEAGAQQDSDAWPFGGV